MADAPDDAAGPDFAPREDQLAGTSPDPDAAISVRDLRRRFGKHEAVRGLSFDVRRGETFGFLGPNGAGKSTTISMLCTLLDPTGGTALIAGYDVRRQRLEVRSRIGLVFQDSTLDLYLSAQENLRFHAALYDVPRTGLSERIREVLELVELWERRSSRVGSFSGGMKRRLEIARGLLHAPDVLFLDEPTVGLDPQSRAAIWRHIDRLKETQGVTIFMTTHYLDEAEICDRIAIVDEGQLVACDTPSALKAGIGLDTVRLETQDPQATAAEIRRRFELPAEVDRREVVVRTPDGAQFVPRLFDHLESAITSVTISRPTLDDVFLEHTGRSIRDAEASKGDIGRAITRMRSGMGSR